MARSELGIFVSGPKKYDPLLAYPCVADWIQGYDSRFTKDQFLRTFQLFVGYAEVDPDGLLKLDPQEVKRKLVAFTREVKSQGKSAWAATIVKAVNHFLLPGLV